MTTKETMAERNVRIDLENKARDKVAGDLKIVMDRIENELVKVNDKLANIEASITDFRKLEPKLLRMIEADTERSGMAKAVKWVFTGSAFAMFGAVLSGIYHWFDVRFP